MACQTDLALGIPPKRPPARVVLVDDDRSHNQLWHSILEDAGYSVVSCHEPRQAVALIAEGCECVITDYQMPGMDGVELIQRARAAGTPAFILLTGNDSPAVHHAALAAGAECVLSKPAEPRKVIALLDRVCGAA